MNALIYTFNPDGTVRGLWADDAVEALAELAGANKLSVHRVSRIEYNDELQRWEVRWVGDPGVAYANPSRTECVRWEHEEFLRLTLQNQNPGGHTHDPRGSESSTHLLPDHHSDTAL